MHNSDFILIFAELAEGQSLGTRYGRRVTDTLELVVHPWEDLKNENMVKEKFT